ncbi:helix-turn-helix transcriptional regulator [Haladaptatus sp.]|uniref:helix-turn-helix transcriptional regulator n=1 Tax=Haladaptatus sp. TaxID=1973141 RepID=UPI003C3821B9
MRSHFALLVVLLSLFAVGPTVVAGDLNTHPASSSHVMQDRSSVNVTAVNGTTIRIKPHSNGDAEWNVSMQFALHNDNETAAFKRMGRDFENHNLNDGDVGFSTETFRAIAKREQEATGRQMQIRNSERDYFVSNDTGTLVLTFIWTNFTRVNGDKIYLHDAFMFDDGDSTWLGSLSPKQNLVLENPDGYRIYYTSIRQDNDIKRNNETIFVRGSSEGSNSLPPDVTYTKNQTSPQSSNSFPYEYAAGFLALVGLTGAGVYTFFQRDDDDDEPAVDSNPVDQPVPPEPDPDDDPEPDLDLLSDEERVEHLLKQNGGRMKQATIVKETNWSNAKVSQLLSAMNEGGRVDKLRIGRENLITLPGEDITDFDTDE